MHTLKFMNPVGLKSDNFTAVRLGDKWAARTAPEDGSKVTGIQLADANGGTLGNAVVRGCWVGPMSGLPAILLEHNHDPVCRTWSGVLQTLAGIYADETIGFDTVVTVLQLSYTGSVIQKPKLVL